MDIFSMTLIGGSIGAYGLGKNSESIFFFGAGVFAGAAVPYVVGLLSG